MKKALIALWIAAATTATWAACTSNTIIGADGKMIFCTTCCFAGNCTTTCY